MPHNHYRGTEYICRRLVVCLAVACSKTHNPLEREPTMDTFEKLIKASVLFVFSLLNAIDMVQTTAFLQRGIEGNIFAVSYPQLWFALKAAFAFALPIALYYIGDYLDTKEDEGLYLYLDRFVDFVYVIVFFANIYYLQLVIRNTRILGRVLP